ncbi:hypothetical protein ACSBR2_020416 [Camellia fascicularis]
MAQQRGWIPVVKQRGRQGRGKNEGCASVFTIFVDNIPNSVNPKGLHNLFTKFGVVKDVFIPNKRRRITNTRFGFVRFDCKVEANVAVQKGNGLWVDDKAIEGRRDSITVKADEIGNGWLYESVVVRLKENYANTNLKKEIEAIGVEDVVVRESGGHDVMFTFKLTEEMIQKLKPIKEPILDWCEIISKGKSGMVLEQETNVWLSCYGIPLNLWNSTNVKRIGGL